MQTKVNLICDRGIAFDGKGKWSFGNGFARHVVILDVDNTS